MDKSAELKLEQFIKLSEKLIPIDGLAGVIHFYKHGEYEMSFEGLIIELVNNQMYPPDFCFREWVDLARSFHLDKQTVFESDFWNKFIKWGEVAK